MWTQMMEKRKASIVTSDDVEPSSLGTSPAASETSNSESC